VLQAFSTPQPSSFDKLCSSHLLTSHDFLCYISSQGLPLPPSPTPEPLPPSSKPITIIFDLDETLVHCLEGRRGEKADLYLAIRFPDECEVTVGINVRPYTK
jgi:hypothetical protein